MKSNMIYDTQSPGRHNSKVLILLPSAYIGGAELRILDISKYLVACGAGGIVVFDSSATDTSLKDEFEGIGLRYAKARLIDRINDSHFIRIKYFLSFISTVYIILQFRPISIFLSLPSPFSSLGAILACAFLKKKTVVRFALVNSRRHFPRGFRRWLFRIAKTRNQVWIALSEDNRRHLLVELDLNESAVELIRDGYCLSSGQSEKVIPKRSIQSELGLPDQAKIILTVGSFCHQKGHDLLLPTIPHLVKNHPDSYFVWLGDGINIKRLRDKIDEYGITDRVFLLGHRSDVVRFLQASTLFVFPTRFEGLPGAVLEAIANEVPIVTFKTSSLPELINHRHTGLLARKDDSCDLLYQIDWALEHPEQMRNFAKAGLTNSQIFSKKYMLEKYAQYLLDS